MCNNDKLKIKNILSDIKLSQMEFSEKIYKNYEDKIKSRLFIENSQQISEDVNNLIILLNFCFYTKNDFFINNFNKTVIHKITNVYETLRTNILTENGGFTNIKEFIGIDHTNQKLIRMILKRYKMNYDVVQETHSILSTQVNLNTVDRLLKYVGKTEIKA